MKAIYRRVVSMASAAVMLSSGAAPLSAIAAEFSTAAVTEKLFINEVCTGNSGANGNITDAVDKNGDYCDWLELYNPGGQDVNISGWSVVKDDSSEYTFGDVYVPAGGTLLVFSCKTYKGDESVPNTGYNLSGDGVKLALVKDGEAVDTVEVPALEDDTTWARQPDGSDTFGVFLPTPGASNNGAQAIVPCNAPVLDTESGMYSNAFDLTMTTDAGNTIWYTTDGTDPTTSSTRVKYSSPVKIRDRRNDSNVLANKVAVNKMTPWGGYLPSSSDVDKGTVVRAVTLSASGEYSEVITKSYFVGTSNSKHNDLPIISVTTDPDNLYNYETGIFMMGKVYDDYKAGGGKEKDNPPANYNQKGKEWERPCHIDFFESDGSLQLSQDCGMRTQGAYSRAAYQKSLRFYAREEYGPKNFKYAFFENAYAEDGSGKQLNKFKKIVVRAGGNDIDYAKYKDSYLQSLVSDRAVDTQEGRPCVMFIDGEYWGIYTLQEDYDDHYYEENYGVDADEVIVYKKGEIDEGEESDIEYFRELRSFAEKNDLSKQANYDKICEMIDVQSFIDYMATEIYINNEDWPGNNYSLWRTRSVDPSNPYADGRWRFNLYDTEMGVDHYGNSSTKYNVNNLSKILNNTYDDLPVIFNAMMKNSGFKAQFINSFMDITYKNFDYDTVTEKEKPFYDAYYPELTKNFQRFPNWANVWNATEPCLSRMHTFLKNRPSYVPKMLSSSLSLPDAVEVNISIVGHEGGSVRLNTIDLDYTDKFTGKYFPGTNITITAAPKDGYTFIGWKGTYSSSDTTITVSPEKASYLQAVFVKDSDQSELCKVTFTDGTTSVDLYTVKGGSVEFPSSLFTREGYTASTDKSTSNVTSDMTVKVTYSGIKYTVRFYSNGSGETSYSQQHVYGTSQALTPVKFTRKGYVFLGWARKSTATEPEFTDKQVVTSIGGTTGSTVNLYAVWGADISQCTVTGIKPSYIYEGKSVKPAVTVVAPNGSKLVQNTDYTVSYSHASRCGTATVTIKARGNNIGSKTISYKIVPDTVKVSAAFTSTTDAVRINWDTVTGADGYRIYVYDEKSKSYKTLKTLGKGSVNTYRISGLASGTEYKYKVKAYIRDDDGTPVWGSASDAAVTATDPKAVKIKNSYTATKTAIRINWDTVKGADGYKVQQYDSSAKKWKTVGLTSKTTYRISGLKANSTYKYRVQAYKRVAATKTYSKWSDTYSAKTKK